MKLLSVFHLIIGGYNTIINFVFLFVAERSLFWQIISKGIAKKSEEMDI